jgi:histidinol-phosphate aminotransferase
VLDSALRAFTEPGDAIAYPDPTFAMVPIFARMNGLTPIAVPLRADYDLDAEALLAANARVIYLCLPNNPTGTAASRAAIERVIDAAPGLVIVDEAYAEYAGEGLIESAPRRERLLVTRTLSKAFGLAGLRVGYAAGNAGLIAEVEKSRGPFKVGAAAERAAIAAVTADRGWMRAAVERLRETRARFAEGLRERGFAPLPSAANFVLVPVDDAARRAAELARRDVAVRPFRALSGIGDALRITIGPWETMERVLAALDEAGR